MRRRRQSGNAAWVTVLAVLAGSLLYASAQQARAADPPLPGDSAAPAARPQARDTPESLAVASARRSGQPVPVPALTDTNTDVVARPDGTLLATVHAKPVHTRRNGTWTDIDTSLHVGADGGVAPKAVLPGLEFSGGGTQPLVRMSSAGKDLVLRWPKPLPAPVLTGSTAEYRSVLPDVDLRITAIADGFTQLLVVRTAQAARNPALAQLTIGMSGSGVTMVQEPDGSLAAVDAVDGGTVFVAPKPMMFDSSAAAKDGPAPPAPATATAPAADAGRAAPAAPDGSTDRNAHAAPVGVEIADDQSSMTLVPDEGLLDAPSTVYPVMIDPGVTTPHAGGWAGISRANPSVTYWKFSYNGDYVPTFGTGYCASPNCSANDVKRVLYSLPVHGQQFNGKHILSAEFDVPETYSYNCDKTPVQLYTTNRINSGTTWNNSSSSSFWAQYMQTLVDAKGWSSACPAGRLEFGGTVSSAVKNKVQQAANGNWTDITFGLRAQHEDAPGEWKRFGDDATLQVTYNLPPRQVAMSDMSMSPGSACQTASVLVNKWPQVTARAYDPDGDRIAVQFAVAWDDGTGFKRRWWSAGSENQPPSSVWFKASGSPFSVNLPSAVPANTGKPLGWEARAWDGAEWGPWSSAGSAATDCYFKIDTKAPPGPVTTSPSYPGSSEFSDTLPWTDGVGQYGTFSFLSASADPAHPDLLTYEYNEDAAPSPAHVKKPAAGEPGVVHLLQQSEGLHYFSVRAVDAAGNSSPPTTYYFNVKAGQPDRATWLMDDQPGAGVLAGSGGSFTAGLAGAAATGAAGHTGTALRLPGTVDAANVPEDYAATDGAVLDTSDSFSVSAWVQVDDATISRSAVSQDGSYNGGFSLGLNEDKWTFKTPTNDGPSYTWQAAQSAAPVTPGQWTHLTGVYDHAAQTLTVYVDGAASATVAAPSVWNARGPLEFGRLRWHGTYTDPWRGSIDGVQVWDRALSAAEVADVAADHALTSGLPAKARWSMDDSGTTMQGTADTTDAAVSGAVTTGVPGIQDKATRFGATGYARTSRPQVDVSRSFSVSAWVKLAAPAAGDTQSKVAVTQNGGHTYAFALYYSTQDKRWAFGRHQSDSDADPLVRALQPDCTVGNPDPNGVPCIGPTTGEWTHLVGVADATAHRMQLFVDGYLVSTTPYTQTTPWSSPGPLQIGADNRDGVDGDFFGDDIDDVRVFDRPVTSAEVHDMIQQRPQLAARWKFNDATGTAPATSPDDLGVHPVALSGTAGIDYGNVHVGGGALNLDGAAGDFAATSTAPFHTGESFTVAGWVQMAGGPAGRDEAVWSIGDGTSSAVTVRWDFLQSVTDPVTQTTTNTGQWQLETVDTSSPTPLHTKVEHTYTAGDDWGSYWNHLAVTYDAFSNQLSLYVDGQLEDQVCDDEDTSGTCAEHTSFGGARQPFEATGGLQFGRDTTSGDDPFDGQIDDVWVYQGILSPAQIITLAGATELDSATGP